MTRYRDKETGEVVEASAWLMFGRHNMRIVYPDGSRKIMRAIDFRDRFEPVEDATAQAGVK